MHRQEALKALEKLGDSLQQSEFSRKFCLVSLRDNTIQNFFRKKINLDSQCLLEHHLVLSKLDTSVISSCENYTVSWCQPLSSDTQG